MEYIFNIYVLLSSIYYVDITTNLSSYTDNEFYQNQYPAGFPGHMPDYYGPTPGIQPVHPVSGLPQGIATFMASPQGGTAVPGNQLGAILPTSGAAGLAQMNGLSSQVLPGNPLTSGEVGELLPRLSVLPPIDSSIGQLHIPMTTIECLPINRGYYFINLCLLNN